MTWSTLVKVNSSSTNDPIWTRNESDKYDARDEPDDTELNEVGRGDFVSVSEGGRPESVEPVSESRDDTRVAISKAAAHFDGVVELEPIGDTGGGSYLITMCSWLIGPRIGGGGAGVRVSMFSLNYYRCQNVNLIESIEPHQISHWLVSSG